MYGSSISTLSVSNLHNDSRHQRLCSSIITNKQYINLDSLFMRIKRMTFHFYTHKLGSWPVRQCMIWNTVLLLFHAILPVSMLLTRGYGLLKFLLNSRHRCLFVVTSLDYKKGGWNTNKVRVLRIRLITTCTKAEYPPTAFFIPSTDAAWMNLDLTLTSSGHQDISMSLSLVCLFWFLRIRKMYKLM